MEKEYIELSYKIQVSVITGKAGNIHNSKLSNLTMYLYLMNISDTEFQSTHE
jgi:hypothetical protein